MKRQGAAMRSISDKLKAGNVQAVAAPSCGGCHTAFRGPEIKK